jgi:hypothetical protein
MEKCDASNFAQAPEKSQRKGLSTVVSCNGIPGAFCRLIAHYQINDITSFAFNDTPRNF